MVAFTLRMPKELRDKIKDLAWMSRRSMNQEIIYALERYVAKELLHADVERDAA